jgi:hypothetical protein
MRPDQRASSQLRAPVAQGIRRAPAVASQMIIYGRILKENSPLSVTHLMIIYGHLWGAPSWRHLKRTS